MPKLIIDNIPLEAPEGLNVLEAARLVGIVIPHFCWHPALGRAGACRACAVKLLDGPVKGIQMSCMLPVQDGMVVSTTDAEAVGMRRAVMEWLMINHPHDCPVCDEGGECQLQDFTIAGGHGIRRYDGKKRTHRNQYLGPYIEHEMNRCIQCYRCSRFYQEYAGGTDFGVMGRAGMVYFGRIQDGTLESPFSGNLVDICPTGVFTDKTARFRARYWDYDMAPSVCPHCSLGCNTMPAARYRELLKVIGRRNDTLNGWFICDRGRFSNQEVNAAQRPRQTLVDGRETGLDQALDTLAERLQGFLELHGPESLAIIGSPRMTLEGNIMAARLRELLGAGILCYFSDAARSRRALEALDSLTRDSSASQADVRDADLVAIVGNLLEQAPMMALAVRQAWRNGARIYTVECADSGRLYEAETVPSLSAVPFSEAKRPVIISGSDSMGHGMQMPVNRQGAKQAFILTGPNDFGCALLAQANQAVTFAEALASGKIRGLVSFEADLPPNLPDGVQVLAAADWLPTELMQRAEITLPVTAWVEMDGIFVNNEGRAQRFRQVMQPGLPIKGLNPDKHPPRLNRESAIGGDLAPSWKIAAAILERMSGEQCDEPLSGQWAGLRVLDAEKSGLKLTKNFLSNPLKR